MPVPSFARRRARMLAVLAAGTSLIAASTLVAPSANATGAYRLVTTANTCITVVPPQTHVMLADCDSRNPNQRFAKTSGGELAVAAFPGACIAPYRTPTGAVEVRVQTCSTSTLFDVDALAQPDLPGYWNVRFAKNNALCLHAEGPRTRLGVKQCGAATTGFMDSAA